MLTILAGNMLLLKKVAKYGVALALGHAVG